MALTSIDVQNGIKSILSSSPPMWNKAAVVVAWPNLAINVGVYPRVELRLLSKQQKGMMNDNSVVYEKGVYGFHIITDFNCAEECGYSIAEHIAALYRENSNFLVHPNEDKEQDASARVQITSPLLVPNFYNTLDAKGYEGTAMLEYSAFPV